MEWKESEIDEKQCFSFFALQAISKEKAYDYISIPNQKDKYQHHLQLIPVVENTHSNDNNTNEDEKD